MKLKRPKLANFFGERSEAWKPIKNLTPFF